MLQVRIKHFLILFLLLTSIGCRSDHNTEKESLLNPDHYKAIVDGDSTHFIVLRNRRGMEVDLSDYGARILSIIVPDKNGEMINVVLGFDNIQSYYPEENLPKLGGTLGRYAGRIRNGMFVIDNDTIHVTRNSIGHCLHGGAEDGDKGWQYKMYKIISQTDSTVLMSMLAPDGENGFPGNVEVRVRFTVEDKNALRIDYQAVTDRATVICMSNQSYFNLSGNPDNSISDLRLYVNASYYLPIDSTKMVTGSIEPVDGTPLDFRKEKLIGRDIDNAWNEQIKFGNGYDHTLVLDTKGNLDQVAARLHCRRSGVIMDIYTTEPSINLYTGNYLYSSISRRKTENFSQRHGLCLETQHFPDSPNHPEWQNVLLRPGEEYRSTTIYSFRTEE